MIGTISIPAAHIRAPLVLNTDSWSLKHGAGHYPGTCWFGEGCQVVLAGHDVTFVKYAEEDHVFHNLTNRHIIGDKIYVKFKRQTFVYRIVKKKIVLPTFVSFLNWIHADRLILTTCFPPGSSTQRLLVYAVPD